uniref:Knottin scorpion toxin-like domain-containing protein n=1 Tax=Phaseolus vulgaris TaxID=3885 RepID=V7BW82_PHAVU|nr:hypothetical protein PHAVU_005G059800g [Phaseolus vulgaris]ESW21305.1 hypothetical protein PHAVU_005G059800g [Phaseolus vulgaris]
MAKQVHVFILFTILFFAQEISAQAAIGECVPKTETFLTGCTQDSTCVRTCQISHYDTGKCITSNFHCICFKECHKMEDVHRD